jgi:radical SAM superfamily enzyme
VEYLETLFTEAISEPSVAALSIGTRPDCLPDEVVQLLARLNRIKPVWVELGLQTIHERTAAAIHRGYSLPVFEEAVRNLKGIGAEVIVHVILGLPGESREDMLDTIRYLAGLHVQNLAIDGIKIQQLQVLRGTQMAREYEKAWSGEGTRVYEEAREKTCPDDGNRERFHIFSLEEYCELIRDCLGILPEDIVIHRLTGDAPKSLLIEPAWCADKKRVLNTMRRYMV